MHAATSIADRLMRAALSLVVAFNLLFLLAFLAALLFAVQRASAAMPTCTGKDLLAEMAAQHPAEMARVRAEADGVPNGKGLLWRIDRAGAPPSFLFGTMHVSDPRVVGLDATARKAFDGAHTLVIETTDVLDKSRMGAAMLERPELMMFTDGGSLTALLPEDERALVDAALAERGLTLASVQKMKPWIVSALVSLPACELARKNAGAPVLDVELARQAQAAGKQVKGLETAISQLEAMASLPIDLHVRGLVDTLELGDRIDDINETMVRIYKSGDTGLFWPFFQSLQPPEPGDEASYAAFQEAMIDARNRHMAESAAPILDDGGAFVAVGALHLAGENGLVALLRKQGYALTRVE